MASNSNVFLWLPIILSYYIILLGLLGLYYIIPPIIGHVEIHEVKEAVNSVIFMVCRELKVPLIAVIFIRFRYERKINVPEHGNCRTVYRTFT